MLIRNRDIEKCDSYNSNFSLWGREWQGSATIIGWNKMQPAPFSLFNKHLTIKLN